MTSDVGVQGHLTGNSALVDTFLQLCEDREIERAREYLAPEIRIEFPGRVEHRSLESLFGAAKFDYQWVRKRRTRFFEGTSGNDHVVVSMGVLYGVDTHGKSFDGIRYVDNFVIRDGLIHEQLVWNDLAKEGIGQDTNERNQQ